MYSQQYRSYNYKAKNKKWKESVCHGFVTGIAALNKSMIPLGFNFQYQLVLLSGSEKRGMNPVIKF